MFLYFHDDHLTRVAKTQKTYGRFLGMIFLEGFGPLVNPVLQWVAMEKIQLNWKNTKKNVIFFCADGLFSAKTA